jgi:hypothetical protein
MKKSARGEVVLSSHQIQATRLNQLEYHRLQHNINLLRENLQDHIARIHREEQGLKLHFKNVVRVVKPNRAYQLWKQAHAREIAQDEARELIGLIIYFYFYFCIKISFFLESIRRKQKSRSKTLRQAMPVLSEIPSEPLRPLLLLVEDESKKPPEPTINIMGNLFRPKTSPTHERLSTSHRIDPILTMLHGRPFSSNNVSRQQQQQLPYDSPSLFSFSSMGTTGPRKLIQGKFVTSHKKEDLDAYYRMALQNQTAYKSVDQTRIEQRKLQDKEFASRHRALKGSMRASSGLVN